MNCKSAQSRLSAYVDRELNPNDLAAVRGHLNDCDQCRAEAEALRALKLMLSGTPTPEPAIDFEARLFARIHAEKVPVPVRLWSRSVSVFMGIAAAVLLASITFLHSTGSRRIETLPDSIQSASAPNPGQDVAFEMRRDQALAMGEDPTVGTPLLSSAEDVQ
jgi:anti-sigma factor RsiW